MALPTTGESPATTRPAARETEGPAACCDAKAKEECCAAAEKAECCAPTRPASSCGCR